jgi:hypothetical protein
MRNCPEKFFYGGSRLPLAFPQREFPGLPDQLGAFRVIVKHFPRSASKAAGSSQKIGEEKKEKS